MDHGQSQNVYEQRLLEIVDLTARGEHDRALQILQSLDEQYAALDHDGWLHRSVLSHRGLILADRGDLAAALNAYRQAQQNNTDVSEYVLNQLAIARTLDRMGDSVAALHKLETGLDAATGPSIPTAFSLLVAHAQIASRIGDFVPTRYRPLLETTCQRLGIPFADLQETASFNEAILAAEEAWRAEQNR